MKDKDTQKYVVLGGVEAYTTSELDVAQRLAVFLSLKHKRVICIRKEGTDEVYKYARGKELEEKNTVL